MLIGVSRLSVNGDLCFDKNVSRKGSFPLDSVSVRVPGVEMLYIIYVQFGEGVIHAPKPDFR